jgi:phenylpropionate dioxygenase-like ring-hydroxylating dioxygenase large terminal subunit
MDDIQALARDLDAGISLPASWYTDPAVAALERDRIFRRGWQYVTRLETLARVGDFVTATVADVPVVLVRSEKGLGAFINVCRHRRHEVVSGAGNRRTLQCPYHAWTYDLDGRLRAAPRSQSEPGFELTDLPLLPVALETWGPFAFVNLDTAALPLAHYLGDLSSIIGGSGLQLDQLVFHDREEWEAEANWKVMIENFLECYHCPVQHPGFSTVVDVDEDTYRLDAHGWFSSQVGATLGARGRRQEARLRRARRRDAGAVSLSLAERDPQHQSRTPEPIDRRVDTGRSRAHPWLLRALARCRCP